MVVAIEHCGDLTRFDAEAADLQLVVAAAEELQPAIGHAAHQVSGAVHPATAAVGLRDEACGGLGRASEVATRALLARQVQLTGDAVRHWAQPGVHDVGAGAAGGAPDGWSRMRGDAGDDRLDRRLGGPVAIECRHAGLGALPLDHPPRRDAQCFTTEREDRQRHPLQQPRGVQLGEHRGRGVDHVQGESIDRFHQRLGITLTLAVHDVQRMAVEQCHQRLPCRVEGERPGVRDTHRPPQPRGGRPQDPFDVVVGVSRNSPMGADNALRGAGGARGEDRVGRVPGQRTGRPVIGGWFGGNQSGEGVPVDDGHWRCLAQDLGNTVGGHRRIQRDDHAAGLQYCQHRNHVMRISRQYDRNRAFGTHPRALQGGGQPVGERVEFAIGQLAVGPADRDRIRLSRGDLGEPGVHGGPRWAHARQIGGAPVEFALEPDIDIDIAHRTVPTSDESLHHRQQPTAKIVGRHRPQRAVEDLHQNRQLAPAEVGGNGDREVRQTLQRHGPESRAVCHEFRAPHHLAGREVLVHEQRVEQLADAGDGTQLGVTQIAVVPHCREFALQLDAVRPHRFARLQPHPQRHGVDEHADHRLHTRQFAGPAGHRHAESDVAAIGEGG